MTISTIILILTLSKYMAHCQARELIPHALIAILSYDAVVSAQNGSHADQLHRCNAFLPKIPEILKGILWQSVHISESEEYVSSLSHGKT